MADLHEFGLGLRISVFCRINGRAGLSRVRTAAFAIDEASAIADGADIILLSDLWRAESSKCRRVMRGL